MSPKSNSAPYIMPIVRFVLWNPCSLLSYIDSICCSDVKDLPAVASIEDEGNKDHRTK